MSCLYVHLPFSALPSKSLAVHVSSERSTLGPLWCKKFDWHSNFFLYLCRYIMEKVDMVLVGAEGVVESGGIINKVCCNHTNVTCFLSKPVHIARWAHMHRFLSIRLSVCHWIILVIHISKSIIALNLKLCHSIKPC